MGIGCGGGEGGHTMGLYISEFIVYVGDILQVKSLGNNDLYIAQYIRIIIK